jgi:hypothetical protein
VIGMMCMQQVVKHFGEELCTNSITRTIKYKSLSIIQLHVQILDNKNNYLSARNQLGRLLSLRSY